MSESLYFFTLHKCASTLFSGYILKNLKGLRHVDYASHLYNGESVEVSFKERGEAYGPIRLSTDPQSPVYQKLVVPVSRPEFLKHKLAVFFVRDPRDVLVSSYYSFGYTHELSAVREIREHQETRRAKVQQGTLDDYAIETVENTARNFEALYHLSKACERSLVLKYEDMIYHFEDFIQKFSRVTPLEPSVAQEIFARTRPRTREDVTVHRRSGQPGGFRDKLDPETVEILNLTFEPVLEAFSYDK